MGTRHWTQEEIEKQVQEKNTDYRFKDYEGRMIGKITVGRFCGMRKGNSLWECHCACGKHYITSSGVLSSPLTRSCGCYRLAIIGKASITHGMANSTEFEIWCGIKKRCFNKNCKHFDDYGGRGVTMCQEWKDSFEAFFRDMGPRPSPRHTIDRYPNNDGNYELSNCRWTTKKEQANNRRSSRLITVGSETKTLTEWGESSGLGWSLIATRLNRGWPVKDAVSRPARVGNYKRKVRDEHGQPIASSSVSSV
jgi:hypothetical protein